VPDAIDETLVAAGFGRRVGALVIDWLASLAVAVLLFRQFSYGSDGSSFATLLVFYVEVVVLTWLIGASFGQRIIGLSVVRVGGGHLSLWRIAVRTALICLVIPAIVIDSDGRGLHDKAVDSRVVRA
jgi:uncharacterized RDD family membrane protein YckC